MVLIYCRRVVYGDNTIAVHVTPVVKLLFTQVLLITDRISTASNAIASVRLSVYPFPL